MSVRTYSQRGEGKVGCVVSLLVLTILVAVAIKVVPVYYANNQIYDIVDRKAEQAGGRSAEVVEKEIRSEIQGLGIPEALAPSAIRVQKAPNGEQVSVIVTMKYSHKVDLYGITQWPFDVDKKNIHMVFENIK
ncbi:MAG: hypothetical protein IPP78_15020 [Holophagaceae bacterium]|nr:hypothetical protein [Holophagaceae bacterium]